MEKKHFQFKSKDEADIFVYCWLPQDTKRTKAVVQVSHGMAEHAARYAGLAQYLNADGYAVYANDHRGHGKTANDFEKVGFLAEKDGWDLAVEDMHLLSKIIQERHPSTPLFVLGHSMGSLLVRDYISQYAKEISGALILATSDNPLLLAILGQIIANIEIKIKGPKNRSKLLDKLSFGKYNSHFAPNQTPFDWLSRDCEAVKRYVEDPYCGEVFTSSFFKDLVYGVRKISARKHMEKIPKDLPFLFLSGKTDPVGNMGKGVLKVIEKYLRAGIQDIEYFFIEGARHELLNETCKEEIYALIADWMGRKVKEKPKSIDPVDSIG